MLFTPFTGQLSKDSFGYSVVELSQNPEITEDDLCMDIFTMFTAGEWELIVMFCTHLLV